MVSIIIRKSIARGWADMRKDSREEGVERSLEPGRQDRHLAGKCLLHKPTAAHDKINHISTKDSLDDC